MIVEKVTENEIASVRIARTDEGVFEFAVSNPFGGRKLVFILSTLYGCPVKCPICDAGGAYRGSIKREDMLKVLETLFTEFGSKILSRYDRVKIQFSRMGEPAFNRELPMLINEISDIYREARPVLSISSVAPLSANRFFEELFEVIESRSPQNEFQLQFSIHSTDSEQRDMLIPIRKMGFADIAAMGERFFKTTGKKTVLNFALFDGVKIDAAKTAENFSKEAFIIKFTPVNPTFSAVRNGIKSTEGYEEWKRFEKIMKSFSDSGYEVIESTGDFSENQVMSNCGQYTMKEYKK